MTTCFGIHIGNDSACLAVNYDGRCEVVANDDGDRITPTIVTFATSAPVKVIAAGLSAKGDTQAITHSYRLLNVPPNQRQNYVEKINRVSLLNGKFVYVNDTDSSSRKSCTISPETVQLEILRYLAEIAKTYDISGTTCKAVLTVPYAFEAIDVLIKCADEAGFKICQIISRPAAAVLAHGLLDEIQDSPIRCIVYRLGGVSLECTLIEIVGGIMSVLDSICSEDFGGNAITQLLVDYLAQEFIRKYGQDPLTYSLRSANKLWDHADQCKRTLSKRDSAGIHIEALCDGIDFNTTVARGRLEAILAANISDTITKPLNSLLGRRSCDFDYVIMVGGTSKVPWIQKLVTQFLSPVKLLCRQDKADEDIALGASMQASFQIPSSSLIGNVILPVTSMDIVYLIGHPANGDEITTLLVPRHYPLPLRRSKHIHFDDMSVKSFIVHLFLRNDETFLTPLACLELEDNHLIKSDLAKFSISCHIYIDGGIHLSLSEKHSGMYKQIMLSGPKTISKK